MFSQLEAKWIVLVVCFGFACATLVRIAEERVAFVV